MQCLVLSYYISDTNYANNRTQAEVDVLFIHFCGKIVASTGRVVIRYVPIGCQAQLFLSAESGPMNDHALHSWLYCMIVYCGHWAEPLQYLILLYL